MKYIYIKYKYINIYIYIKYKNICINKDTRL